MDNAWNWNCFKNVGKLAHSNFFESFAFHVNKKHVWKVIRFWHVKISFKVEKVQACKSICVALEMYHFLVIKNKRFCCSRRALFRITFKSRKEFGSYIYWIYSVIPREKAPAVLYMDHACILHGPSMDLAWKMQGFRGDLITFSYLQ